MCSYEEFKPVRKLLIKHKEKTHRTNKEIGMEIGISDFTVAGIIRGENQRTSMSVYEKIMAWAKLIK
jgi:hypothetical protein